MGDIGKELEEIEFVPLEVPAEEPAVVPTVEPELEPAEN